MDQNHSEKASEKGESREKADTHVSQEESATKAKTPIFHQKSYKA
jgi:hypothetical protein